MTSSKAFSITKAVADRLGIDLTSEIDRKPLESPRNTRILAHYQREIAAQHIDCITALERCLGDLCGANHRGTSPQRGEIHA
jgi:hypothetical protein